MSRIQAEVALKTRLQEAIDAHTDYPIEYELANYEALDPAGRELPYLKVAIKMLGGAEQKDLGLTDVTVEQWGQLQLSAVVPCGTGTRAAVDLMDFLVPFFDLKKIGIVQCRAVAALEPREVDGLWHERAIVPFYYHRHT